MDPDAAEEQSAQAVLSIAFPYNHDLAASSAGPAVVSEDVLSCDSSGKFTPKQFLDICDVCRQGCSKVAEVARQSLVKSFQNLVQQSQLAQTPDTAALAPAVVGT